MKNIIYLILVVTIVIGCESQTENSVTQNKTEQTKEFIVKIKYKTNKAGEFKLALYNIVPNQSQNVWIQINEKVAATTAMDNITANFGENISNSFRIDFDNQEEIEIKFESIIISYGEKEIQINPIELKKYFSLNEFITQDDNTYTLKTKIIEDKHNPQMMLKKEYLIDLKKD